MVSTWVFIVLKLPSRSKRAVPRVRSQVASDLANGHRQICE